MKKTFKQSWYWPVARRKLETIVGSLASFSKCAAVVNLHQQWLSLMGTKRKKGSRLYPSPLRLAPAPESQWLPGLWSSFTWTHHYVRTWAESFPCCCVLIFIRCGLFTKWTHQGQAEWSPRGCDWPFCQLPYGYPAASYLHREYLSTSLLVLDSAPYASSSISPLFFLFLCSGLQTSFKLHRNKTLLSYVSKTSVELQRAIASVLKLYTYTCLCSYTMQKHNTC